MRVVAVFEGLPHGKHGGADLIGLAVLTALCERGFEVHCIAFPATGGLGDPLDTKSHALRSMGIGVHLLPPVSRSTGIARLFRGVGRMLRQVAIRARTREIFFGADSRPAMQRLLSEIRPDVIIAYHWNTLAALEDTPFPVLGIVSDPIHQTRDLRRQFMDRHGDGGKPGLLDRIATGLYRRNAIKVQARLLKGCGRSGGFAAQDVAFFRSIGVTGCRYYRAPIFDPFPAGYAQEEKGRPFKIMHIGHLQGIATLTGIELLAEEILPRLRAALPPRSFEIHLVGGYFDRMPERLRRELTAPEIIVRGHLPSVDAEFRSSHVLLVPTPIRLGMRVRILTAFSFGTCTVAHVANSAGTPELDHDRNCLLGESGAELAEHCVTLFHDPEKRRRIEREARRTYEEAFSIAAAGGRIATELMELAAKAQN
jgi:glycosyltransferase involved in cell wall biosynthesis